MLSLTSGMSHQWRIHLQMWRKIHWQNITGLCAFEGVWEGVNSSAGRALRGMLCRRVAAVAMRVLKHYQQQADGNQAPNGRPLRDLLLWLCSYRCLSLLCPTFPALMPGTP